MKIIYSDHMIKLYIELRAADYTYYVKNERAISDAEYDNKKTELKYLEQLEGIAQESRLSKKLGLITPIGKRAVKRESSYKSIGMDDAFSIEEAMNNISNMLNGNGFLHVSNKLDGLTGRLFYAYGVLEQVLTRGDGETGEEVTAAFLARVSDVKNILFIEEFKEFPIVEVRGEITASWEETKKFGFVSARSFASGKLRSEKREDDNVVLNFSAFDLLNTNLLNCERITTRTELFTALKNYGFNTPVDTRLDLMHGLESNIKKFWEQGKIDTEHINHPLDGLVISFDNIAEGFNHEKNRFALKFKENEHEVEILAIAHQVGRTGKITPVGTTEPWTSADGGVNTSVTLHNYDKWYDAGAGSTIAVIKSGAVIPKLVRVINSGSLLLPPNKCPSCGSQIVQYMTGHFCGSINDPSIFCLDMFYRKVINFCETLGIKGMGEETAKELVRVLSMNGLQKISLLNFFVDSRYMYADIIGKNGEKLAQQIDECTRKITYAKLLEALSFDNIGENVSTLICEKYSLENDILDEFFEFTELKRIEGIGDIIVESLRLDLNVDGTVEMIKGLIHFFKPVEKRIVMKEDSKLTGKSIVITGAFIKPDGEEVKRGDLSEFVKSYGASLKSGVSKKTDYLIVGSEPGKVKIEDAVKNEVPILTVAEFLELL